VFAVYFIDAIDLSGSVAELFVQTRRNFKVNDAVGPLRAGCCFQNSEFKINDSSF